MNTEKEKLYEALLDAIQKSPHFANIPLPAILDNQLETLKQKYGYNDLPEDVQPKFEEKEQTEDEKKTELKKKLKEKLKHLNKRRSKVEKKTVL